MTLRAGIESKILFSLEFLPAYRAIIKVSTVASYQVLVLLKN